MSMNTFDQQPIPSELETIQHLCQKISTTKYELRMVKANADFTTHGDLGAAQMYAERVPKALSAYEDALGELYDYLEEYRTVILQSEIGDTLDRLSEK